MTQRRKDTEDARRYDYEKRTMSARTHTQLSIERETYASMDMNEEEEEIGTCTMMMVSVWKATTGHQLYI